MKFKANFQYKPSNFQMNDCQIEKVVELSEKEFAALKVTPLRDHPCVVDNKDCMFSKNGIMHCLLVLGKGGTDGILIESEGYNFPRCAAYIPGMRDIVNTEMDRAADFIIRQGIENTSSGNWRVCLDELEKHLGLTVHEGGGLDARLLDAMRRRPEVADVGLADGHIDAAYYLDYCRNLEVQPGGHPPKLSIERRAALFDRAVDAVVHLYGGRDRYAILHDKFGMTLEEIYLQRYLSDLSETGVSSPNVMTGALCIGDFLEMEDIPGEAILLDEEQTCSLPLDGLRKLSAAGEENLSPLLDMRVKDVVTSYNPIIDRTIFAITASGLGRDEIMRWQTALGTLEQAGQDAGPVMG